MFIFMNHIYCLLDQFSFALRSFIQFLGIMGYQAPANVSIYKMLSYG